MKEMYTLPKKAANFNDLAIKAHIRGLWLSRETGKIMGEPYRYVLLGAGQRSFHPDLPSVARFMGVARQTSFENALRTPTA